MTATTGRVPIRSPQVRTATVSAHAELLRSGVGHAVGAAVAGLVVVAGVVVLGWTSAADPASSWRGAAGIGGALWLSGHLVDLAIGQPVAEGGTGLLPATLSPLGVSVALAALHVRTGRRLSTLADGWGAGRSALVLAVLAAAVTTGTAAAGVAVAVSGPAISVHPGTAAVTAAAFALVATASGVGGQRRHRLTSWLPAVVQAHLQRCLPAAAVAVTCWLLCGSILVTVALVVRIATVADASAALAPGAFGGIWLLAGQLVLLPNAISWSAGLLSGAPLQAMDQTVSLAGSDVTAVPPLPLFSVLPAADAWPLWAWLGVVTVVAAGAAAGWRAQRQRQLRAVTAIDRCVDAVVVGVGAGGAAALVTWVAHGSVAGWGPVGADPVTVGVVVAAEVALGAMVAGVGLHLLHPRITRRPVGASRAGR